MRNISFANEQYYHIYDRGVDHRDVFMDQNDDARFYMSMLAFNDELVRTEQKTRFSRISDMPKEPACRPLVEILSFCLLSNHYHILVRQLVDGGVTQFFHRLMTGYTKYFNKKYERTGRLFESSFKAVMVKDESHLFHLPRYIHLNALDVTDMHWRDGKVNDWNRALALLNQYQWSSHGVFMGDDQLLPVVSEQARAWYDGVKGYQKFIKQWGTRDAEFWSKLSFDQ